MNSSCPQDVTVVGLTLMANPKTVLVVGGTGGVEAFLLRHSGAHAMRVEALEVAVENAEGGGRATLTPPRFAEWNHCTASSRHPISSLMYTCGMIL